MNLYENDNSLKKKLLNSNKITLKEIFLFNKKFIHKVFDSLNISLLILIILLSFLSLNSQRKWTNFYTNLIKTRVYNSNLIDYISITEEFYIKEIESLNTFKKTTPKDLIYLDRQKTNQKENYLIQKIKNIKEGLKDSPYQKSY